MARARLLTVAVHRLVPSVVLSAPGTAGQGRLSASYVLGSPVYPRARGGPSRASFQISRQGLPPHVRVRASV